MGLESAVEDFVLNKAIARAAIVVAQAFAAFAVGHSQQLSAWGVSVSVDPDVLSLALLGGVHVAGQWLAAKYPKQFGWLVIPSPAVASAPAADAK